jgi:TPR repeat protein
MRVTMMSRVRVLLFAADPLSAPPHASAPRLRLDEDVRQLREKVRAARHPDALEFDVRWAARTDDLLQALSDTRPQVVHFSGHGTQDGGLLLMDRDGAHPRRVSAPSLAQLFRTLPGDVRLVVLNACHSRAQAEAVADVVGCAIGVRGRIPDAAAITFAAAFYRAVACGESIAAAYEQARVALELEHDADAASPELFVRDDVDPGTLVLVRGRDAPLRARRAAAVVAAGVVLSSAVVLGARGGGDPTPGAILPFGRTAPAVPAPTGPAQGDPLADAHALREAGNHAAAVPLFRQAADRGSAEAMAFLGMAYLRGEGTAADTVRAIHWIRGAARKGDLRAMTALGSAHRVGAGVSRSDRYARHWLGRAAAEEYPPAMRELGHLHRQMATAAGYDAALAWYRKAADAGSADALVDLGMLHEQGWGVSADQDAALALYRAAAARGSAEGMAAAGQLLQRRGEHEAAREWYLRGAANGSAEAMNNLGVLYHEGLGVRRDRGEAIRWFRRAAETGSVVAAENLRALGGD